MDYAKRAANWWSTKIRNSTHGIVEGIDAFEKALAIRIKDVNSREGHMYITSSHSWNWLTKIAKESKLSAKIPRGYEMRIFVDTVYVYDSLGRLVDNF